MILVSGGTGMVGAHLLFACAQKKLPIRALFRRKESLQKIETLFKILAPDHPEYFSKIEWVQNEINDLLGLEAAFVGVKQVYHCAAKISFAQFHQNKLLKTNIDGTANMVNLSLKYKVEKFAYVSSIAALGAEQTIPLVNENDFWNSDLNHTTYAYSKYGAELEVWRASQEGLPVVIINPGIILGSHFWERSSGTLISKIAQGLRFYPTGNAAVVALEDVVNIIVLLMESDHQNERYILVSENISYKDLLSKIATVLGKKAPSIPLSKFLLYSFYIMDKTLYALGLKKSFLSQALIGSLCSEQKYDGSKIEKTLPYTYQKTDVTLKQISKDYKLYY